MKYKKLYLEYLNEDKDPDYSDEDWNNYVEVLTSDGGYTDFETVIDLFVVAGLDKYEALEALRLQEKMIINDLNKIK